MSGKKNLEAEYYGLRVGPVAPQMDVDAFHARLAAATLSEVDALTAAADRSAEEANRIIW